MRAPPQTPDALVAFLVALEASCYTGRVQVTFDFNRGGVSRLQVAEVVPLTPTQPRGA